jgi:hypothetical protein
MQLRIGEEKKQCIPAEKAFEENTIREAHEEGSSSKAEAHES